MALPNETGADPFGDSIAAHGHIDPQADQTNGFLEAPAGAEAPVMPNLDAMSSDPLSQQDFMALWGQYQGDVHRNDTALQLTGAHPNEPAIGKGLQARVVAEAMKYIGMPYKWGGDNPQTSFDCSGLVQWVFRRAAGISLPRVSFEQAGAGKAIGRADIQPGDLVWWDENGRNPGADHIAIYVGNGQIIEAPHSGVNVRMRKLGAKEGAHFTRILGG